MIIKVLVLTTTFPRWKNDSTAAFVLELSKKLCVNGLDIFVIAPHQSGAKTFEIMDGVKIYRYPYFFPKKYQTLAYGEGVLYNLKRYKLAKIQVPLFCISELFFAIKIIRKENIDLIHSHWLIPSGLIGAVCKKIFGLSHVASVHGSDVNTITKSKKLKSICSFIFNYSDIITANSLYTKERLKSINSSVINKVKIIPMGVDLNLFNYNLSLKFQENLKSDFRIISVGRLIDIKGIKYLILAMKEIINKTKNARLFIIGDGPEKESLMELVSSLNLINYITFTGFVNYRDLPSYYNSADVFVLPSISLNGKEEALGVVTIEAMASGVPVIGTNVGGVSDIITDGYNGFLVPEKSPSDIANKVLELFSNKELAAKFKLNGISTVNKKFSWDIISKNTIEIYSELSNGALL